MNMIMSWLRGPAAASPTAPTSPEQRRRTLAAITAERARHAADVERGAAELLRANDEASAAEARLLAAARWRAEIAARQLTESLTHGLRVSRLEAQLRAGAPEVLDRFLHDLLELEEATRQAFEVVGSGERPYDEITGKSGVPMRVSNRASVQKRLAAIVGARGRAEALKLEALSEAEALTVLRTLLANIPEVESPMIEPPPLLTPGEARAVAWRLEEAGR